MRETITELKYATSRYFEGDPTALHVATTAGLKIIKSGTHDHHAIRLACQAIAIDGLNGTVCPHNLLVPCMTNKVIRAHESMGNISPEITEAALVVLPRCENTTCPNHTRFRAETPTAEELAESGHLIVHSDYYPWE